MSGTLRIPFSRVPALKAWLLEHGFELEEAPHAFFRARGPEATLTVYRSGKVLAQGRAGGTWFQDGLAATGADLSAGPGPQAPRGKSEPETTAPLEPHSTTPQPVAAPEPKATPKGAGAPVRYRDAISKLPDPDASLWIGIDETGKGDYFGPLVVVAACVERGQLALLSELGVGDSKGISDRDVRDMAATLRPVVAHETLILRPPRYNALYAEIGNLNELLAWAHATVGASLAERTGARIVLSDQFARRDIISARLRRKGYTGKFVQRTRAEDDPAVAAASVIARAAFLRELRTLERDHGVKLHKGAGPPVLTAGRTVVRERGPEILEELAKLHFKTTDRLR